MRLSELRTIDGRRVEILDPGKLQDGAGPDVRDAVIKVGSTVLAGDVEFHRDSPGWNQHGHHLKQSYNRVILHVVLNGSRNNVAVTQSGRAVPLLVLLPFLTLPAESLWKEFIADDRSVSSLPCFRKNDDVPHQVIQRWLHGVDNERMELRILRLRERLLELVHETSRELAEPRQEYGEAAIEGFPEEVPLPYPELSRAALSDRRLWEQVLYEGILEGLGYSRNRTPFVRLARIVPLSFVRSAGLQGDPARLSALLFGVSGLLPTIRSLKEKQSRTFVRSLLRSWREFRTIRTIGRIHPAEWQFSPSRPHNFPTVRIAAVCGITQNILLHEMFRRLIQTAKSAIPVRERLKQLQRLFIVESDEFWTHHYNFDRPTRRPIRLLGLSRINDIIVNTVFPLSLLYARVFRDATVRQGVHALREGFPLLSENSSTRIIEKELFHGEKALTSLSLQQGAIQLYRYYCAKKRCAECDIGRRVFGRAHAPGRESPQHKKSPDGA